MSKAKQSHGSASRPTPKAARNEGQRDPRYLDDDPDDYSMELGEWDEDPDEYRPGPPRRVQQAYDRERSEPTWTTTRTQHEQDDRRRGGYSTPVREHQRGDHRNGRNQGGRRTGYSDDDEEHHNRKGYSPGKGHHNKHERGKGRSGKGKARREEPEEQVEILDVLRMHNTMLRRHGEALDEVRRGTQIMVYISGEKAQQTMQAAYEKWKEARPEQGQAHPDGAPAVAITKAFAAAFKDSKTEEVRKTMEALGSNPKAFQNFRLISRKPIDKAPQGTWNMVAKLAQDSPHHRHVADMLFHLADNRTDMDGAMLVRDTAPMDDLTRRISRIRIQ